MKITITIILLALFVASCRPQRSAILQTAQQSQQQFQQRQLYQFGDSLSRHWFFYTDSPFVYHPDSALIGRSGYMWFDGSRYRSSIQQWEQDSSQYESNRHTEQQKERKEGWGGLVPILCTVLLIAVIVVVYVTIFRR